MAKHSAVSRKLLLPLLTFAAAAAACDDPITEPVDNGIAVPQAYVFNSRFVDGASSVQYPGQTVRNLLASDLKTMIDRLGKAGATPVTAAELLALYDHNDAANLETLTTVEGMPLLEKRYNLIATGKKLAGTISGDVVIGFDQPADRLIRDWLAEIAANSQKPELLGTPAVYTSAAGVDLSQMVDKVLGGAVAYSQATGKYLSDAKLFGADNRVAVEGKPYTQMEHYWDEAFGYFGAARDYNTYTDADLAGKSHQFARNSFEKNDNAIDLQSEYNFSFARYAGKRSLGRDDVNFRKDIFDAFLKGRTLIVNEASTPEIAAQRQIIAKAWEKVIAANIVHYTNDTLEKMKGVTAAQLLTKDNTDLNKYWSEMRAFAIALQYNPIAEIQPAQLAQLAQLMGNAPTYALPGTPEYDAAVKKLEDVKTLLQSVYKFSDANMASW